jgi:flagellar basal-body rod protein FlgC
VSLFGALGISGSGIDAAQSWIDASAGNIANANDAVNPSDPAYQAQTPVLEPISGTDSGGIDGVGQGVDVAGVDLSSSTGELEYEPDNTLANSQGDVRVPSVDLGQQMVDLVTAQNTYQANSAALNRAITAYQSALTIGQ